MEPSPSTSAESILKVTAGLIAALPLVAEIDNLREEKQQNLRLRIKYPDQNVHFIVPRMRDLKRIMTEDGVEGNKTNARLEISIRNNFFFFCSFRK